MTTQQFQALYCRRFNCAPAEFEERVFRNCLYWHARLVAPVMRKISPRFFVEDFKFVRYLGSSAGLREVDVDVRNFRDSNLGRYSFLRNTLKVRVSGRKAAELARTLFSEAQPSQ